MQGKVKPQTTDIQLEAIKAVRTENTDTFKNLFLSAPAAQTWLEYFKKDLFEPAHLEAGWATSALLLCRDSAQLGVIKVSMEMQIGHMLTNLK